MFSQETLDKGLDWYNLGLQWLNKGMHSMGLSYLEKALGVFRSCEQWELLNLALHHKLLAHAREGFHEEAETLFGEVLSYYSKQQDNYGKALLFADMADCLMAQERLEGSLGYFYLAQTVAEQTKDVRLQAHITMRHAKIYRSRSNFLQAIRFFEHSLALISDCPESPERFQYQYLLAESLSKLDEFSDSTALLEEVQLHMIRNHHFQEALEPLKLLSRMYEKANLPSEKALVADKIHFCGQKLLSMDEPPPLGSHNWKPKIGGQPELLETHSLIEATQPIDLQIEEPLH